MPLLVPPDDSNLDTVDQQIQNDSWLLLEDEWAAPFPPDAAMAQYAFGKNSINSANVSATL